MPRRLDDWIEGFLQYTNDSEAPESYRVWVAHSTVAACLQRKCYVEMGRHTYYPNMYVVLVGPSGTKKGTAMDPGENLLKEIHVTVAANATTREALIRAINQSHQAELSDDGTMLSSHSSLTIFSAELTCFLGYQNLPLMINLTDWYDCKDPWRYETKNMGKEEIRRLWVNLIGGTTPANLDSSLPRDAIGGGLTSRIIFVYEEKKGKTVPLFDQAHNEELWDALRSDLDTIRHLQGAFRFTADYVERYVEWYIRQDATPPISDPRFEGYHSRRGVHLAKLTMISSASRSDSRTIGVEDFDRSLALLRRTEETMAQTFASFGRSDTAGLLVSVGKLIKQKGKVGLAELMQAFYHDATKRDLEEVLSTLLTMRFCRRVDSETGTTLVWIDKKGGTTG